MILLFSVYWILYQNLPNSNNWRELQVYVNSTISTSLSLHNTYKNVQAFYDFHNSNSCSQKVQMYFLLLHQNGLHPMDTSLLIRHRFDVEIPRGKFIDFSSKLHPFWQTNLRGNYDIGSTRIFRRGFDFQNRRNVDEFITWIFLCRSDVKSM